MEKIAFIICYNNELYMRECLNYISWLKVPQNVETEVIGIKEADSMVAGYNVAMHDSNAKYKVYLHQDVFILNEDFIYDFLEMFEKNPEYGMLGVMGSDHMVLAANYWSEWNVGECYVNNGLMQIHMKCKNPDLIQPVDAIDGMLMITQYDVEWREDVFNGFDFYDISQSIEFRKRGYKVGVPHQKKIWCHHDCGASKLNNYDVYRKKFCEEYKKYGYIYSNIEMINEINEFDKRIEKMMPILVSLFEEQNFKTVGKELSIIMNEFRYNTQLCNLFVINEIVQEECTNDIANGFYNKRLSYDELKEKYILFRFLLFRIEFEKNLQDMRDTLNIASLCDIQSMMLIANYTVFDKNKIMQRLRKLIII